MLYAILAIAVLAILLILKIVKGVLKLILILIVIGIAIAIFAGSDDTPAPVPSAKLHATTISSTSRQHTSAFLALVDETVPRINEVSAGEVCAMLQKLEAFLLIDVREESEWANGHIDGAQHLARGIIERDIESRIPDK